ncbi:MAG TPA: acyl-CoA dehydrogenase, partial [Deltaproteobacteria bacterium]|nr:acyl-CoA dehydrogenase [Deltaproteobacteria bacterium]
MSLPDRNNPYAFDAYLEWRSGCDYYRDDPFFQKVVKHFTEDSWQRIHEELSRLSGLVSYRWRDFSEQAAVPEKRPFITHFDGHNHRIDRIVRPMEVLTMEKEVFSEALFSARTEPWMKLAKMYLIYQNGEACIACPLTCTEGLVELLRKFADSDETRRILLHCSEGIDGDFGIGAQYLSEIQGGSDVPSNVLEAVQEDGA